MDRESDMAGNIENARIIYGDMRGIAGICKMKKETTTGTRAFYIAGTVRISDPGYDADALKVFAIFLVAGEAAYANDKK